MTHSNFFCSSTHRRKNKNMASPPALGLAAAALPPLLHAYWVLATGAVASLLLPGQIVPARFK